MTSPRAGIVLAALAIAILALTPLAQPSAIGSEGSDSQLVQSVSGDRIMNTVRDLEAFGSRIYYVESCLEAGEYIFERFSALGLYVYYQDLSVNGYLARNVVAVLNGSDPSGRQILFGAHYDSANVLATDYLVGQTVSAPGADDDASGVAAVVELATVLSGTRPVRTVKFVAFAAEESGLNGSRHFVRNEVDSGVRYEATAILDMIGYRAGTVDSALLLTREAGNKFATAATSAVERHHLDIMMRIEVNASITYSDHYPFWLAGYPSMLVIEEVSAGQVSNPYYHTSNDTSDKLSQSQIEGVTAALLGAFLDLDSVRGRDYVAIAAAGTAAAAVASVAIYYFATRRRRLEA
jgi:leucyl aminopeptidase